MATHVGRPRRGTSIAVILAGACLSLAACEDGAGVVVWVESQSAEQLVLVVTEQASTPDRYILHAGSELRQVPWVLVKTTPGNVRVEILREAGCTSIFETDLAPGEYRVTVDERLEVSVGRFAGTGKGPDGAPGLPRSHECVP